jgi:hypothetical protein
MRSLLAAATAKSGGFTSLAIRRPSPSAGKWVFYTADVGRPDQRVITALDLPRDAAVYLCGPDQFMGDMRGALAGAGIDPARIHTELFGTRPPINPGILELAEACDVPTRFSCRSGVCHMCVTPLIEGTVNYTQTPLELPPKGTVLICSAEPREGIVLDL